ncbi:transporter [Thalassotalea euphylliae]|uniref:Transporter n=1 Tax=Thalassotalea euphylliae TaxID=1655234 RepID=A0A3E0UH59_9GAMM|nr:transporter [Thalassotalea euphylliae]REL35944.1 transporter [Thalassotalea euphylliae]
MDYPCSSTLKVVVPLLLASSVTSFQLHANTPSEMADMSLQQLLSLTIEDAATLNKRWQASVLYKQMRLDGYMTGSTDLSNEEVLFRPVEVRTDSNYPILPTVITQEAVISQLAYRIDENQSIGLSIPLIRQSTDHISIVPSYPEFTIDSQGLGDLAIDYKAVLFRDLARQITYSVGVSLPTGSIDQKGDTPRAAGDQQLPYTMQLGSGTWDFVGGLGYQHTLGDWRLGADLFVKLRTGKNDRDYRLGNRFALSTWARLAINDSVQPFAKVSYHDWGSINGRDDEITVPGPFPYPANITNPNNYGGRQVNTAAGVEFTLADHTISLEYSLPVYQSLNGVQTKEKGNAAVRWQTEF